MVDNLGQSETGSQMLGTEQRSNSVHNSLPDKARVVQIYSTDQK